MKQHIIHIKGMHCKSCEILIGDAVGDIKNVKKVDVSLKDKKAIVYFEGHLNMADVNKAIEDSGYEVGIEDKKHWLSRELDEYFDLGVAFLVLVFVYLVLKRLGLFNLSIGTDSPSSLFVVLLVGLTAGISTCMAIVGGLVLGISARHREKHPEASFFQNFRPHLFFNLGRIMSYFVLGGLIGLVGKVFQLSNVFLGFLIIFIGFVMLVLGIKLTDISPKISNVSLTLPSSVSRFFGLKKHHEKEYSHFNSMMVGALTFFLPCGFTQAMQLYAISTGSFVQGALIMSVFAIGTAPGLLSIGGLTSALKGVFARKFFKFAGILVIFLSLFNISNGYNLTGLNLFDAREPIDLSQTNVEIKDGIQIINMEQRALGYSPNKFIIQKGIPVKWIIDSKDVNSCASSIIVPKLKIQKYLKLGENIVEFTPTELGDIKFSCSMGMYTGKFTVIEAESADNRSESFVEKETDNDETFLENDTKQLNLDSSDIQIVKTVYASVNEDISPNSFTVEAGKPVRFEVDVKEEGFGCMSTIMIPGLVDEPELLEKGKTIVFEFTPEEKGIYDITCAMGVVRGVLRVV